MGVIVIGAGLSGLAAARTLQRAGREVTVLEQSPEIGGRVKTTEIDGYRIDQGFQVLLTAYQEAAEIWPEDEMDLFPFAAGAVIHGHQTKRVFDPLRHPTTLWATLRSGLCNFHDVKGLLGLRLGLRGIRGLPTKTNDEKAPDFLKRLGFSDQFMNAFFRPFLGGVFLDESLAVPADAVRFVMAMFARGEAALPAQGMAELPTHLAKGLTIECNCKVINVEPKMITLEDGSSRFTEAVVDTRPPDSMNWRSTEMMAFRSPPPVDMTPVLHLADLNDRPDSPVLHACAPSLVAPGYAPPGQGILYATLRTDRKAAHVSEVQETLAAWFEIPQKEIEHLTTISVRHALPNSPCQSTQSPRDRGIYRSGDWMTHASIEGALRSGRIAAEAVLHDLDADQFSAAS